MKQFDWKRLLPYLVALVAFFAIAFIYCAPILEGKVLVAGDANNWMGAANEAREFKAQTGETTWWTNSQFGGMPTYQITGSTPSNNLRKALEDISHFGFVEDKAAIGFMMAYFVGFFLMLLCFGVNPWLSIIGALAIGFSTYFMFIIPAGHLTKASALACLGPVFGGFYAIFRKRYWLGFPMVAVYGLIGITLHPQMTYYMCMLIGVCCFAELFIHISERRFKDLGISVGVFVLALLLAAGSRATWMKMNQEYVKETMRGGHSELTQSNDAQSTGLDLGYATAWSYGKAETMTFLIPNFMGGASGYNVGEKSELYKNMVRLGVPRSSAKGFCSGAPTYWGDKAFTSGPVYMGALICFLFVLGLIVVGGPYKWALLIATFFSVLLAWGKNFMPMTELFYNWFPMYNKFRAVESILIVAEFTMPILGILALQKIVSGEVKNPQKSILIAGGITAGICLIFALFGGSMCEFTSAYDNQWKGQVGDDIYRMIVDQRASMMQADAWRSFAFVAAGVIVMIVYAKGKMKAGILYALLAVLVLADMIPVNKRFFNENNFTSKRNSERTFAIQGWEQQILEDKTLDYRVFNVAANTFNDARTSYRLKSIGGYSAAKLRRYQDLIDAHISQNNWAVLNMLNTKYIVTKNGVMPNPEAFGNVWFVDEVQFVNTPDEESAALWNTDLKHVAVADAQFADVLKVDNAKVADDDSFDGVHLTSYKPNELIYETASTQDRVAVFSEIYYPHGWHLYIDGQESEIGRVNYVLRAAVIPAGNHTIKMEFVPEALAMDKWSLTIIILALVLSLGAITFPIWKGYVCKKAELAQV